MTSLANETGDMQTKSLSLLNQWDVAERWRISPRTLETWRWRGKGPHYLKIGNRIGYRIEDIEAFEKENILSPQGGTLLGRRRRAVGSHPVRTDWPGA